MPVASAVAGHLNSTSFPRGEEDAQPPAPQVAVPILAKGEFPPDVNPAEPVRQLHK